MKTILLDACLTMAVLCVWLGCLGAWRLSAALDRLHGVTFVNAAAGAFMTLAAFVDEGVTTRTLKLLLIVMVMLVTGAATSHAIGRAILLRDGLNR